MGKSFAITFSVSVIIFATTSVIMLMLLLPKQLVSLETSVDSYQSIEKSNYTYTKTKDISKDALLKEYTINSDDITKFKQNYQYVAGNSDPFTKSGDTTGTGTGTSDTNSAQDAIDKTTNSNGGVSNPESTTK